jgi:hypothetical protein
MEPIIKANLKMIKHMVKGNLSILMVTLIKEIGYIIELKALANTPEQRGVTTKEDGKTTSLKVMG